MYGVPKQIRTAVPTVKGSCPRPLDDGDLLNFGGGKRDRTVDLLHAMQALSQLSYTPKRVCIVAEEKQKSKFSFRRYPTASSSPFFSEKKAPLFRVGASFENLGGGKRDRTVDLLHAMQALSQLSYTPKDEDALYRAFRKKARASQKIFFSSSHPSPEILFSYASGPGACACRMDFL